MDEDGTTLAQEPQQWTHPGFVVSADQLNNLLSLLNGLRMAVTGYAAELDKAMMAFSALPPAEEAER